MSDTPDNMSIQQLVKECKDTLRAIIHIGINHVHPMQAFHLGSLDALIYKLEKKVNE